MSIESGVGVGVAFAAVPALRSGALRQAVVELGSIKRETSYPSAWDDAVTRGMASYRVFGSRGVRARSSIQTLPFPPDPAVIAISIAAKRRSTFSAVGPHANEI